MLAKLAVLVVYIQKAGETMYGVNIERLRLEEAGREELKLFLGGFGLDLDSDIEYTVVARKDTCILGTCSAAGRVLKCFAVDRELQGEGIASKLVTKVIDYLFDRGIYDYFVFTKPENNDIFTGMGFSLVHSVQDVLLLEGGTSDVRKYVKGLAASVEIGDGPKAALVMNCNPFTLGHRYIIQKASEENQKVLVFAVEEDKSVFPFKVRFELMKKGTEDLKNVTIIPGGRYIISSNTFPSYFLKKEDQRLRAYTELDAGIFGRYFAGELNITKRYVGTEPIDKVTEAYNLSLQKILPQYGVEVSLIKRADSEGEVISASKVRKLIAERRLEDTRKLVPESTYSYLISTEAEEIVEKILRGGRETNG